MSQQFKIHGYKTYHRERNKRGGGAHYGFNRNIPCKMISVAGASSDCETILI